MERTLEEPRTKDLKTIGGHAGPLAGLLVLDFGQAAVGPVAASYLGMLGATVIKVEQPRGDSVRIGLPTMRGTGSTFIGNNVTKFGLVLDLKDPLDRKRAIELAGCADVVIDNFRSPEVMSRLGLDYFDVLSKRNPSLIYVQASAYGISGPWKGMVSFEWVAQAASGFAGATGERGGLPEFSRGTAYLDWNGAMINTIAMLAGLHYRSRRGHGLMMETSQYGSAVFSSLTRLLESPSEAVRHGSSGTGVVPDRVFETSDGYLAVCAPSDAIWSRLCVAIERPDLGGRAELQTAVGRFANRAAVEEELQATFRRHPTSHWVSTLRAAKVPCAAHEWETTIATRLLDDPQVHANGMLVWLESWFGRVLTQAPHWKFTKAPTRLRRAAPQLGEHSQLIVALLDRFQSGANDAKERPGIGSDGQRPAAAHQLVPHPLMDAKILEGVRILEVGAGLATAMAGMVLTQLGAAVTKIEAPAGDWLRTWGGVQDESPVWRVVNHDKAIVKLDLTTSVGRAALDDAIRNSDAVIALGTPGERSRLGTDGERVHSINSGVLYCGISGWGTDGPLAEQPATEIDVQTVAGMTLQLGRKGHEPVRQGFELVSINTGLAAVQAVLAGLLNRGVRGEHVEVSMLQTAIAISQWDVTAESGPDEHRGRQLEAYHWAPDHGYSCRDGRVLITLRGDENAWTQLLIALDRVDLLADERFSTIDALRENEHFLPELLEETLADRSFGELEVLVRERLGGTIVPIPDPKAVLDHPQTQALEFVERVPNDNVIQLRLPVRIVSVE